MISNASTPAISLVKQAHRIIGQHLKPGDITIDATVGNGHDTLFLLDLIKPNGKVFGFDIQQQALESTQTLLADCPFRECLALILANHVQMKDHIPTILHGKIKAVMFNLGYMPGGDKRIITQCDTTIAALSIACELLTPGGIITIIAYPGHSGGGKEVALVQQWCEHLHLETFQCRSIACNTHNPLAPILHVVHKRH